MAVNKPLKDYMRSLWADWIGTEKPTFTPAGNRQRPSYGKIAEFASKSLEYVNRQDLIKRSFSCCGLVEWPSFDNFSDFFNALNHNLRSVLSPNPLDISRECQIVLRRCAFDIKAIDEYLGLSDFDHINYDKKTPKKNRRATANE